MANLQQWLGRLDPSDPTGPAARRLLSERLTAAARALPPAAHEAEADVENVHRLRVSARRARASLSLFRDLTRDKARKRSARCLKRLQRASGRARDLDVLIARVAEMPGQAELLAVLRARRGDAQSPLVTEYSRLQSKSRLDLGAARLLETVDQAETTPFGVWAPAVLRPVADRFLHELAGLAAEHDSGFAALHRLRIRGKRLRYSLEAVADALPRTALQATHDLLVETQDRLGELNDHITAHRLLRELASIGGRAAASMERLAAQRLQEAKAARAGFERWCSTDRRTSLAARVHELLPPA